MSNWNLVAAGRALGRRGLAATFAAVVCVVAFVAALVASSTAESAMDKTGIGDFERWAMYMRYADGCMYLAAFSWLAFGALTVFTAELRRSPVTWTFLACSPFWFLGMWLLWLFIGA